MTFQRFDYMKFDYTITDENGIHARPAGVLIQEIKKFESDVTVTLANKTVEASSIIQLMTLQAKKGDTLTIEAVGSDEEEAIEYLKEFMKDNF